MRNAVFVAATLIAGFAAADPLESRPATEFESDFIYLMILDGQSGDDGLQMLTDVGVPERKARELLDYVAAHKDDHGPVYMADTANICRNVDDQFSNPLVLANEIKRQKEFERAFQNSLVNKALEILDVPSLAPIRELHMRSGGILSDVDTVQLILDGTMKPADVIARKCTVLERIQPAVLAGSEPV